MEGKSKLLVPVDVETSGPSPGDVATRVPSRASAGRRAGPSGSSKCSSDSTSETSAGSSLAGSSTVTGPSPVAGLSPVSEPSPVAVPLPAAVPLHVAGPPPVSEPLPASGSAPAGPSATGLSATLDIPSGDVRRTRPVGTLSSSLVTGQRPAVRRRPR